MADAGAVEEAAVPGVPGVRGRSRLGLVLAGAALAIAAAPQPTASPDRVLHLRSFGVTAAAELVVTLTVRCDECAWEVEGREAVVLNVGIDRRWSVMLPVTRSGRAPYRVFLGRSEPGEHHLRVSQVEAFTASALRGWGSAAIENVEITQVTPSAAAYPALTFAPFLYARPDTVGRFTDVPLFMWYETEPTPRGTRYRYSVVFSNEDGGTPADRLMATWGRTTDIEYVYGVEVNARGEILHEDMQGPGHELLPYRGSHVHGGHAELWVATDNNMVLDRGGTGIRYAPAPVPFPLAHVSREAVMDANPWLYAVMAKELAREGKIAAGALPGKGVIPDPRRFAYLEGCGTVGDSAIAFALLVGGEWMASDRGLAEYRLTRDGCFRAAVPLPGTASVRDVRAVRVQAFTRAGRPSATPVRFSRLNTLFGLDEHHAPGPRLLTWEGPLDLHPGGPPLEIPVR